VSYGSTSDGEVCVEHPSYFSTEKSQLRSLGNNNKMSKELQNSNFYCPITDEIMIDPVIDYEGNSYERTAIEEWLRSNGTSPITRSPLNISQLVPNRSLRKAIEDELLVTGGDEILKKAESKSNRPNQTLRESKTVESDRTISIEMSSNDDHDIILLSVLPSDDNSRCPVDIVCVVDVSGSMGESAIIKDAEDSGLSLLDIVKHALKTIVVTLSETDRFALVTYSNDARVIFSLTSLNSPGKARVNRLIDELSAGGMTNLWDGLEKGLDVLTSEQSPNRRNSAVFLLTDGATLSHLRNSSRLGVPNVDPPRGYIHRLRRYRDSHGGIYPGVISTFGFGYSLKRYSLLRSHCSDFSCYLLLNDSSLLKEIAIEGDGMYMFIPDSGFVGTAFVNALSNQLVSIGSHATIELSCSNGIR
jgi:Mg-chelatase subunit ChlD